MSSVESEMNYNTDDLKEFSRPFPNAVPTTNRGSSTPETSYVTTESIRSHFERLETRMDRIEGALNKILDRLRLSAVDDEDGRQRTKLDGSTSENQENLTVLDTTNNHEMQQPGQEPTIEQDTDRQYTYTPLDTTKSHIRILRLHRAEELLDPLIADLVVVGLDDDTIKGINQSDIDERGDQVCLMRRIYKRASSVHVWLGEEADDSSVAIDLLNTLGAPPKHAPGERTIRYPSFTEEEVMRHWNALRALFKRPWWERVWIRQEIALHVLVKLWCGGKSFDMNALGPALFMLRHISSLGYASTVSNSDDKSTVSLPWDFHPRTLVELRRLTGNGLLWVGLAQLLRITRSCKATDARDTVFSVLGMADPEIYPIVPNYRQELNQVLLGAAQAVIGLEYGLEILGACQNPEKKHGLPSWIPFLLDKWKAIPFQTANVQGQRFIPRLTEAELPSVQVEAEVLVLQGCLVDAVESICKSFIRNKADAEDMEFVYSSWRKFAKDASLRKQLWKQDISNYVKCEEQEKTRNWIRFLTVLVDEAQDLQSHYGLPHAQKDKGPDSFLSDPLKSPYYHIGLNPKLTRSYLLPSSHSSASPHPNHRVHAGFQSYGVGRRLCITKRGLLALIPAEAQIGDPIAVFKGASFPYVLRKSKEESNHILIGEAFIPSWVGGIGERNAETLMREEWRVGLHSWIRIC
ncbi:hypothetical protein W97_08385 [Coniosporium apollinis CBS 100218]|uniref:Heterokaryon incompatibility domain-containing protein n=1 Tax=Coniosporium apollinis (strain CBS 100218) TaxID=1168221 RepID=R7Z4I2_CONA1|nr:uncharacterized protein W97_08385 [Coniosporium apollinis CBS 100218]EON69072.1 hypothetical protein W97_08385 [Coniosporium apollinis CBS 100218]